MRLAQFGLPGLVERSVVLPADEFVVTREPTWTDAEGYLPPNTRGINGQPVGRAGRGEASPRSGLGPWACAVAPYLEERTGSANGGEAERGFAPVYILDLMSGKAPSTPPVDLIWLSARVGNGVPKLARRRSDPRLIKGHKKPCGSLRRCCESRSGRVAPRRSTPRGAPALRDPRWLSRD